MTLSDFGLYQSQVFKSLFDPKIKRQIQIANDQNSKRINSNFFLLWELRGQLVAGINTKTMLENFGSNAHDHVQLLFICYINVRNLRFISNRDEMSSNQRWRTAKKIIQSTIANGQKKANLGTSTTRVTRFHPRLGGSSTGSFLEEPEARPRCSVRWPRCSVRWPRCSVRWPRCSVRFNCRSY